MGQPVSINNPIDIQVTPAKRIEFSMSGGILTGDIGMHSGQGNQVIFACAQPFMLWLTDFVDVTPNLPVNRPVGQGVRSITAAQIPVTSQPAQPGPVFLPDPATKQLTLISKNGAQFRGTYKYCVAVIHTDGALVTIDPQIIVD